MIAASILFLSLLLRLIHLSGRHTSASAPKVPLSLFTTHGFIPMAVFSGIKAPETAIPPFGTTRSKGRQKGGCSLTASWMQASKNSRSRTSTHFGIGFDSLASNISANNFLYEPLFCNKLAQIVLMTTAVESEPAIRLEKVQAVGAHSGIEELLL